MNNSNNVFSKQTRKNNVIPLFSESDYTVVHLDEGENPKFYETYTASGDSMIGRGIADGCRMLTTKFFDESDIKLDSVCIIKILSQNYETAKMIRENKDGTISLISAHPNYPEKVFPREEIQIVGIVVSVTTKLQTIRGGSNG